MTDITVSSTSSQYEKRGWLWGLHGTEPGMTPSITLDVAAFTSGTHYPNGYLPSGLALGKITSTGLYGPYDPTATGTGRETFAGLLFGSLPVRNGTAKPGGALVVHAAVDPARLPIPSQVVTSGAVTSAVKSAVPTIIWG